jgi:hypothetical protein
MRIEMTTVHKRAACDFYTDSGSWLGWAKIVDGVWTLQSLSAPLEIFERIALAERVGALLGCDVLA